MVYDEEYLEEIKNNVDLLEYIGNDIELKKKGKDYFGHCPKHVDLTPSFSVNTEKNIFYCFSCGRGFSIFDYLMEYEGMSFDEAVKKASKLSGVDIGAMCQSQTVMENRRLKRRKANQRIEKCTHEILAKEEYERFKIGSVDEWLSEGIRQEEIDLFEIRIDDRSNRIVYPVYDVDGNFINIKGRTRFKDYKKMGICKYIYYYPVGTVDYFQGLNITEPYIKETREIIIFESIKSVMKLFGNDVKNSTSAEKHTLTPEQIAWIIKSDIKDVVFAYDSDVTYREKAVRENINMLKRFVNLYIIEDKEGVLGGKEGKNSPIDLGFDIWQKLYSQKKKIL